MWFAGSRPNHKRILYSLFLKRMPIKSKYRFYLSLMIFSGIVLAATVTITSVKIMSEGKHFTQSILDEHRILLLSTLGFGQGMMAHMGSTNYDALIKLALESQSIKYLGLVDQNGEIIDQSDPPEALPFLKRKKFSDLRDNHILDRSKGMLLVAYKIKDTGEDLGMGSRYQRSGYMMMPMQAPSSRPEWFLVAIDTSAFTKHYHDMLVQTVSAGSVVLLRGILIIIFLQIMQRYEMAHLSIERLLKIKRVLDRFVPRTAKNVIEKDPDKRGLLSKYIEDATILFLDVEGFSLLLQKYPQERINQDIESYFSAFLHLIQKNGGDINETAGDGMMVIFQDPDQKRHARNAIQSALEMKEHCRRLAENKDSNLFPIHVNIGICSGEVYLGTTKMTGSEGERWTFTASGAVTIMAARLSQFARQGQILIGEETARRVEEMFILNSLGQVSLKNIENSGVVYELSRPAVQIPIQ
jgi:class 3 adenylate cyclase